MGNAYFYVGDLPTTGGSVGIFFGVNPVNGVLDEVGIRFETEFGPDVFLVGFDRLHADVELFGDLSRPKPLADPLETR